MNDEQYKLIVDAARRHGAKFPTTAAWLDFKAAIDAATGDAVPAILQAHDGATVGGRRVSPKGIALMHEYEGCVLKAYPDPGSKDGNPWTIGRGSTGPGIHKGVTWTQAQADARFEQDLVAFAAKVEALLGNAPTTQHQFDAMVALAYNIGIGSAKMSLPGGFTRSSVLRKHKAGDYVGAAAAFAMWIKNDGKIMRGLVRRRAAEADLYDDL